jgi:hypothetical protein
VGGATGKKDKSGGQTGAGEREKKQDEQGSGKVRTLARGRLVQWFLQLCTRWIVGGPSFDTSPANYLMI